MRFLSAFFVALGFASWPVLGAYSRVSGAWSGIIVVVGTFLTMLPFSLRRMESVPSAKAIAMLMIAGLINGLALQVYSAKTSNPEESGIFISMVSMLMVIIGPLLNWVLNGKALDHNHAIGFVFGAFTIYFLSK